MTRLSTLLAEVLLDARSRRASLVMYIVLSCFLGFALVGAGAVEASAQMTQQRVFAERGVNVWRVQTAEPFSGETCDGLSRLDGVREAGSAVRRWKGTLSVPSGAPADVLEATAGYVRIGWNTSVDGIGMLVGSSIAANRGLRLGTAVNVTSKSDRISRDGTVQEVLPPTERVRGGNQVLVLPVALPVLASECLVEAEPGARASVERVLLSAFGSTATVAPVATVDSGISPERGLGERVTTWAPLVVGGLLLALVVLNQFGRRADWALYRVISVSRLELLGVLVAHTCILCWVPFAAGILAGTVSVAPLVIGDTVILAAVLNDVLRTGAVLSLAPPAALATLEWRRGPLDWLKGQ